MTVFEQTTGAPHAIASSGGKPNPSYSDGNTNASHAAKSAGKSASGNIVEKINLTFHSHLLDVIECGLVQPALAPRNQQTMRIATLAQHAQCIH